MAWSGAALLSQQEGVGDLFLGLGDISKPISETS